MIFINDKVLNMKTEHNSQTFLQLLAAAYSHYLDSIHLITSVVISSLTPLNPWFV